MKNKALSIVILLTSKHDNLKPILNWLMLQFQHMNTEYIVVDTVGIDVDLDLTLSSDNSEAVKVIHLSEKLYQSMSELKNDVIQYISGKYMMMINIAELQGDILGNIDISNVVSYISMYSSYINNTNINEAVQNEHQNKENILTSCEAFQNQNKNQSQNKVNVLTSYEDIFKKYVIDGDTDIAFLCLETKTVLALSGWNKDIVCGEDYELLLRICDMSSRKLLDNHVVCDVASILNGSAISSSFWSTPPVIPVCYQNINKPVYQDMYYTYSYILGKYSDKLKKLDLFDKAFQNRYKEAVYFGIEDYFVHSCEQMIGRSDEFFTVNNNTNPIAVIMNSSICNGALESFAKGLFKALIQLKQAAIIIDIDFIRNQNDEEDIVDQNIDQLLTNIAEYGCRAIVGVQSSIFARQMKDGNLWGNKVSCPKLNIMFDHPLYISYYLVLPIKDQYICSQDEGYVNYIKEYYPNIKDAWHLPPAGILPKQEKNSSLSKRKWDVTFVAVYYNYRKGVAMVRDMEKSDRRIALKLMIYLKNHPNTSASEGFRIILDAEGIKLSKTQFAIKLHHMRVAVQTISFYYREKIVTLLTHSGIDVHVFSNTWRNCPYADNKHLIIHSDVSFDDSVEIMADSKISLNVMNWHKGGMTERIANAMLAGSVCVSDKTSYLERNFTDGKDIVLFSLEDIYSLPQRIKNLLADMDTASKIAAKGKENALKNHTWINRANSLMEILREIDK